MRSVFLTLSLALALPLISGSANATTHACQQLRQTIFNTAPANTRTLPYGALTCQGVSQIHLILITNSQHNQGRLTQQIEAIFRSQGLIR